MLQSFVITGNVEIPYDFTSIKVQECDRPFCLAYDMNLQAISH